jgi:hypothetical protein
MCQKTWLELLGANVQMQMRVSVSMVAYIFVTSLSITGPVCHPVVHNMELATMASPHPARKAARHCQHCCPHRLHYQLRHCCPLRFPPPTHWRCGHRMQIGALYLILSQANSSLDEHVQA